ncbi:serine hydrolase [bacterium]|nr:MAG: serine hydrolase [bacterium]
MKKTLLIIVIANFLFGCSADTSDRKDFIFIQMLKKYDQSSALSVVRNDTVLADYNANVLLPLASTAKTLIALEYAKQAAANEINPDSMINLDCLERFYIEGTDGGAHPMWINYLNQNNLIINHQVPLREVARGMIDFSSNANTEFLMERLTLDRINQQITELNVEHTPMYYFISALGIGLDRSIAQDSLIRFLNNLSFEERSHHAEIIHGKLATDFDGTFKASLNEQNLSLSAQKIWSDHLPASTAKAYVDIMKKINDRNFPSEILFHIDEVFDTLTRLSPANRELFYHAGGKGGDTDWILTLAFYFNEKSGSKTEFAVFFNNLSGADKYSLENNINNFMVKLIEDSDFREELITNFRN